jgi:hypothetical protein
MKKPTTRCDALKWLDQLEQFANELRPEQVYAPSVLRKSAAVLRREIGAARNGELSETLRISITAVDLIRQLARDTDKYLALRDKPGCKTKACHAQR